MDESGKNLDFSTYRVTKDSLPNYKKAARRANLTYDIRPPQPKTNLTAFTLKNSIKDRLTPTLDEVTKFNEELTKIIPPKKF